MTALEKLLRKEIDKVLNEKVSEQENDCIYECLNENIRMSVYSHQQNLIDFTQLKISLDIMISVFYKTFPNLMEDIYKSIDELSLSYSNNPGTVIYFQLINSRNEILRKKITRLSNKKHN